MKYIWEPSDIETGREARAASEAAWDRITNMLFKSIQEESDRVH